jgi:hypothetical protein
MAEAYDVIFRFTTGLEVLYFQPIIVKAKSPFRTSRFAESLHSPFAKGEGGLVEHLERF